MTGDWGALFGDLEPGRPEVNPLAAGVLREALVLAFVEGAWACPAATLVPPDSRIVEIVLRAARHNRDRFPHLAVVAQQVGISMSDPVLRADLAELTGAGARPRVVEAVAPEVAADILGLVCVDVTVEQVRAWSAEMVEQAVEWAAAVHMAASDNDVEVPARPGFLDQTGGG